MPGVETSLPVMLTHAADGKCSIPDVVRWMCEGPSRVYGIQGKGRLQEGRDADLVLVDMESSRTISDADTWTRVGWTADEGSSLTGWPVCTVVDGTIVHSRTAGGPNSGEILVEPGSVGRALRVAGESGVVVIAFVFGGGGFCDLCVALGIHCNRLRTGPGRNIT